MAGFSVNWPINRGAGWPTSSPHGSELAITRRNYGHYRKTRHATNCRSGEMPQGMMFPEDFEVIPFLLVNL